MCSVLYLDSILTLGARYSFLGTELGAAAASHRALTPVHSVWAGMDMEDEGCMIHTSYYLRPLLDTLLQLMADLTKAKYRKNRF